MVRSDHAALARKLSKSAHDCPITPRQARWIERLMPFQITLEHIARRDNVVSDALSRYPSLKTYAFTLSLISPTSLGVLGCISFVARDDVDYQWLLAKVLKKTNSAGSTDHVVRTLPSPDEPTLEKGAKSTALAQPRILQPELDPGYHMDTRMRPRPEK